MRTGVAGQGYAQPLGDMKRHVRSIVILVLIGAAANIATCLAIVACARPGLASLSSAPFLAVMHARVRPYSSSGFIKYESFNDGVFGLSRLGTVLDNGSLYQSGDERIVVRLEIGWPFRCLYGVAAVENGEWASESWLVELPARRTVFGYAWAPELPLRPIWPGWIVNTVLYATILWPLIGGLLALRGLFRVTRGQCPTCGYPIGESAVCTECGGPLPANCGVA